MVNRSRCNDFESSSSLSCSPYRLLCVCCRFGQQIAATVLVKGQLTSPQEFGEIVLRANPDGSADLIFAPADDDRCIRALQQ